MKIYVKDRKINFHEEGKEYELANDFLDGLRLGATEYFIEESEEGIRLIAPDGGPIRPIHYVTIEIPLSVLATNEELQKKLVFLRLVYSHMESITRKGITYLSHIDITDILDFLPKEEFIKFKAAGVRFPADVEALYSDTTEDEETTV
ncbi:MAG: hypothetical protein DLD55_04415 [candidate division SR1 bacterium]|nr:MAG: hypothetical protein DLD55_04415 [candidate division SR1 bacterium]